MKTLLTLTIFTLTAFGCSNNRTSKGEKLAVTQIEGEKEKVFKYVSEFPIIKDTTRFIIELRRTLKLKVHESQVQKETEKITAFRKVKLYGSDKEYYFIEYDWGVGSMAEYPWKYQILLTTKGNLIKSMSGQRFGFISILPNQNPFLLTVIVTAKGNGGHELYKISADTLENVYEGYSDYDVQTYDAHEDLAVYEPNELNIQFSDENKDGFKDLIFTGQKLMLGKYTKDSLWYEVEDGIAFSVEKPAERIPIKYVFLYDRKTGHFKKSMGFKTDEKEKQLPGNIRFKLCPVTWFLFSFTF
jgi:hypothetical protein